MSPRAYSLPPSSADTRPMATTPPFVPPAPDKPAFNCPTCQVYARQTWFMVAGRRLVARTLAQHLTTESERRKALHDAADPPVLRSGVVYETPSTTYLGRESGVDPLLAIDTTHLWGSKCEHCEEVAIWCDEALVWPKQTSAPPANADLPGDIREVYKEAAAIMADSPRGAAALLRLALEKLCRHLEPNPDWWKTAGRSPGIADYTREWAARGSVDRRIEKALDSVRLVGNNAVHPGVIDLDDDAEIVETLFFLVNYVTEKNISEPGRVDRFFDRTAPPDEKEKIARRDRPPEGRDRSREDD